MPKVGNVNITDEQLRNPRIRKAFVEAQRAEPRRRITSPFKGSTFKERVTGVVGGVKTVFEFFFPDRRKLLSDIKERRGQTLLPEEAIKEIFAMEKDIGIVGPETFQVPKGEITFERFEKFLDAPRIDPIGVISGARRVVAGLGDDVLRRITRSTSVAEIKTLISKGGRFLVNEIDDIAKTLSKERNPKQIENILSQAELRFRASGARKVGVVEPPIPKELQPLAEEARKFKTAEEFVEAQKTKPAFSETKEFILTKTETKGSTRSAVFIRDKPTGDIAKIEFVKSKKTNEITVERSIVREDGTEAFSEGKKLTELQDRFGTKEPEEIAKRFSLFDTDVTKNAELVSKTQKDISQLTDLFNQVKGIEVPKVIGVPRGLQSLVEEARKFDTAEDFVNRMPEKVRDEFRSRGIKGQEQLTNFWNNNVTPKELILTNLNPTGSLFVDYTPEIRATIKLGENITTLDKTSKKAPDTIITIYRGVPKIQKTIVPGDFITTNFDLAKSYTGDGNVISKKVKMRDVLDDITEPLGEEYIYRPQLTPEIAEQRTLTGRKLKSFLLAQQGRPSIEAEKLKLKLRAEVRGAKAGIIGVKETLRERKTRLRVLQDTYQLTDLDVSKIRRGRDISTMSNEEFGNFIIETERKAGQIFRLTEARVQLNGTIFSLELRKTDNLRQALKLPTVKNMSLEQLTEFDRALNQFKSGDEFLSVRKLQMVDRTDLRGIKTTREAKERLANELGIELSELDNIKISKLDRYRYDTSLAEKNPFYGLMVDTVNKNLLNAEARYLRLEKTINELVNTARKSRPRTLGQRVIAQDKLIFKYLETPDSQKAKLARNMTREELNTADFIRAEYAKMRDYLVQFEVLKKYQSDYITHIRRGFLEEWKETGLLSAFKNVFKQYQHDQAVFNIIDDTGNILPLEKFFKFSMRRTGEIKPTENVARAFLIYAKSFEKKVALDAIVPKLDIYVHSLTPKVMTPRGLEFDRSLKTFVNEWINTKKGRTAKQVGIEQGGVIDLLLRAGNSFVSLLDLGLNIPVGIASRFGENITNFVQLGVKRYATGLVRTRTAKGKRIIEKYTNFVGRTPFDEIADASLTLVDKVFKLVFGLFQDATVKSNKTFLLGSMSKGEYAKEAISSQRLAELTREMGRWRVVQGAKSIVGATSLGATFTKYKTWAIPPLRTIFSNLEKLRKTRNFKSREAHELLRATFITLSVVFLVKAFVGDDDDDTFSGQILKKSYRDAMTILGALDPATITSKARLVSFIADLGKAVSQIIRLEKYKEAKRKGELKGIPALGRVLTPRLIKQFIRKEEVGIQTGKNPLLQGGSGSTNPLLKGASGAVNPLLQ